MSTALREAVVAMDRLGRDRRPFVFLFDFELVAPFVVPLEEAAAHGLLIDFPSFRNHDLPPRRPSAFIFRPSFLPYEDYLRAFDIVRQAQTRGESYLLNLTFPTPLETDLDLPDFFRAAQAPYKLLLKDRFVVFSPETFVTIRDNTIRTFPMKGTCPAAEGAARLLDDPKETAEHITVVDLLRNDLSRVGTATRVEAFQTVTTVRTHRGDILQTHSVIAADLPADWPDHPGSIITELLPAGSVSGAPKRRTLELIRQAEGHPRGYYTGIAGVFDESSLESAVLIRYIEKTPEGLFYRSGGGITVYSDPATEYRELQEKVYAPFA